MAVIYYNRQDKEELLTFAPLQVLYSCHAEQEQAGVPSAFHSHENHLELQYIYKGKATIRIGDHSYEAQAGDLVVYNAGVLHDETADVTEGMCFYNVAIRGVNLPGLRVNTLLADDVSPALHAGELAPAIEAIFHTVFEELSRNLAASQSVSQGLLSALLVMALRQIPKEPIPRTRADDCLLRGKRFIEENFRTELTIGEMAAASHMSESSFAHQFKKRMGFSPLQYLIRCRIGCAQNLLTRTDMTVTEVSAEVGYDNLSHFNNQFKKIVGYSPQSYRKARVGELQYKRLDDILRDMDEKGFVKRAKKDEK